MFFSSSYKFFTQILCNCRNILKKLSHNAMNLLIHNLFHSAFQHVFGNILKIQNLKMCFCDVTMFYLFHQFLYITAVIKIKNDIINEVNESI